jgi:hypothetical protein
MDETEADVLYDKNGEAGSFLTDHPFLCLTGTIFEDTEAGLHDVSRRVIKLFRFVGGVIEEQYHDNRQSEGKADTGRNEKQADRADRNGAQGERERQWELRKLRHINLELYHQIGDLLRIKLQVLSSETKCNTPADLIIGTADQDLRECCHAMLFAFVG